MADTTASDARPDIDILDEIHLWLTDYPPLQNDRHHIDIRVESGAVTVSGHLKTPITRSYLRQHINQISGVVRVDDSALYDDETIRLGVGPLLPQGAMAAVEWGTVVLTGALPGDPAVLDQLVASIAQVRGVYKVVTVS
jgi:hypothetical protein